MSNRKDMIIHLIDELIKKILYKNESFGGDINHATKADLKNETGANTSSFAKKSDLAHLKSNVDKLHIDKFKNVPTHLSNLKSGVDKLDIRKLKTIPVDLSKLNNVVKN